MKNSMLLIVVYALIEGLKAFGDSVSTAMGSSPKDAQFGVTSERTVTSSLPDPGMAQQPPAPPPLPASPNATALASDGKSQIPWDARIHSGNKAVTSKGLWQKRKNVDKMIFLTVEKELINATSCQSPLPTAEATTPPPPPPSPSEVPMTPPSTPVGDITTYVELVQALQNHPTLSITAPEVTGVLAKYQVPNIGTLAADGYSHLIIAIARELFHA